MLSYDLLSQARRLTIFVITVAACYRHQRWPLFDLVCALFENIITRQFSGSDPKTTLGSEL